MTKKKAIEIGLSHIEYILHNVANNHTPQEIGEAIDLTILKALITIWKY